MRHKDKTFSGSLVSDLRIWWRHVHSLFTLDLQTEAFQEENVFKKVKTALFAICNFMIIINAFFIKLPPPKKYMKLNFWSAG